MANNLTGDFDVVAEFALPGANRVLAAMHQCERFLHSISVRVDDNSPAGSQVTKPTMVGVADTFGGAVANQRLVTGGRSLAGAVVASDPLSSMLGQFINPNLGGFVQGINPSHLQGVAQLQLFPPTVDVLDATGKNVTVTINTMARYFPDPKTAALAEFMRGDLQITAPVNQIASQMGQLMEFDFKADQAREFHPVVLKPEPQPAGHRRHQPRRAKRTQDQLPILQRLLALRRCPAGV